MQKKHKANNHIYIWLFAYTAIFTLISYNSANLSSIIYDYPFHLGRIVGLAKSIENHDFLPNLNYLFLNGSGYAVSMFYGNWMFYLPAIVFLQTKVATLAFASFVFQSTLAIVWSAYYSLKRITNKEFSSITGAIMLSCSVVYFGFGMTAVVPLIPLLLLALYRILYEQRYNPILLAILIALLVQTHIISTIVLAILSLFIVAMNFKKMNGKTFVSFTKSVVISMFLMAGYLIQFVEQNLSQDFFVGWKLRDFPFVTDSLMRPGPFLQLVENYFWPTLFIFLILSIFYFGRLSNYSKQLVIVTVVMFLMSTRLIPWEYFRTTYLSVFQYTERLTYLLPIILLFGLAVSLPKAALTMCLILQLGVYLITFPMRFMPNTIPYSERGYQDSGTKIIRNTNEDALEAFTNPFQGYTYDTSGDEYLTIDVNHENIRNGTIREFEYNSDKLRVSNVKNGYNSLEFDVDVLNSNKNVKLVLPRVWYKGYVAEYSYGAVGSQPELDYGPKSNEEIKADSESGKSTSDKKVLHDGRAVITLNKSGYVRIEYRKTLIQWIGYCIEFFSFVIVSIYGFIRLNSRKNKVKN